MGRPKCLFLTFASVTSNSAGTQAVACLECLFSDINYEMVIGDIINGLLITASRFFADFQLQSDYHPCLQLVKLKYLEVRCQVNHV